MLRQAQHDIESSTSFINILLTPTSADFKVSQLVFFGG
jgi:hypothetical protein